MRLVLGQDSDVALWAEKRLGKPMGDLSRSFVAPYVAIGLQGKDGDLIGAAVLTHFDGHNINLTVVGRGAIHRGPMRAVISYCFDQLGCSRVSVVTRSELVVRMAERLGWKREGVMRKFYGNADGILLGLLKEDFTL